MANIVRTLGHGEDVILPRTISQAVYMEDGTTLEYALKNSNTSNIKIRGALATTLGVPEGTSLEDYLQSTATSTSNILAAAEVIE